LKCRTPRNDGGRDCAGPGIAPEPVAEQRRETGASFPGGAPGVRGEGSLRQSAVGSRGGGSALLPSVGPTRGAGDVPCDATRIGSRCNRTISRPPTCYSVLWRRSLSASSDLDFCRLSPWCSSRAAPPACNDLGHPIHIRGANGTDTPRRHLVPGRARNPEATDGIAARIGMIRTASAFV
jgi:hypothetical protein